MIWPRNSVWYTGSRAIAAAVTPAIASRDGRYPASLRIRTRLYPSAATEARSHPIRATASGSAAMGTNTTAANGEYVNQWP